MVEPISSTSYCWGGNLAAGVDLAPPQHAQAQKHRPPRKAQAHHRPVPLAIQEGLTHTQHTRAHALPTLYSSGLSLADAWP